MLPVMLNDIGGIKMKKFISLITVVCLLFSLVSTTVFADENKDVLTGYVNTVNAKTGNKASFQGVSKNEIIYMLPDDIAAICEYKCETTHMEKDAFDGEFAISDDKLEYFIFSRNNTTTDYVTQVYYYDGYAQTMGKTFEIDSVNYDGNVYLNLEKMMYLMHAQWCVEGSFLYYYPLDYNIFDFIGETFNYMSESSVQHSSLLYDGEGKWGHSTRVVLSHVLNDIDMRIFIPFYGSDMIQQEWYNEAILQLATTDESFIDEAGSKQISEYLKDSPFHKVEVTLNLTDTALDSFMDLPDIVSNSNLNKFSKWVDFSTINTSQLEVAQEKIGNLGDAVSVVEMVMDFNEINTRSKGWGEDFVNGLDILYTINEDTYKDYGKYIVNAADDLLDEFEDPTKSAEDTVLLETYGLVMDKLLDNTIIGHIESIITLSNVIIKSNPEYANQIENADLMNTVHASINVENVFLSEFVDSYHDYLHYLDVEDGTSSLNLLELLYVVSNQNHQKIVETKAISDMRSALEMFLKTSLRNKTYVYHFNYFNNGGSYWTPTTEAKELEEDIYKTYALLSELISTRDYDAVLYLDESFESMYSDEYGLMRQKIDDSIVLNDKSSGNASATTSDISFESVKKSLIDKYGLASQKEFVSCENAEVKDYPDDVFGIVSMLETDLNNDNIKELLVIRVVEAEGESKGKIWAEIYQNNNGTPLLSASQAIYDISFCSAANIYLFYSDVLSKYCIVSEAYSNGSYTGVTSWLAEIYTTTESSIELYKKLEEVPTVGIFADFEEEFNKINAPFAKYCTDFDKRDKATYYHPLCEVEHVIFGDSGSYMTRNHKLKITDISGEQENSNTYTNIDNYMCQNIEVLLNEVKDLEKVDVSDGSLEYSNKFLIIGASSKGKKINFISINTKCNYSIHDVYVGDDLDTAIEHLNSNGWIVDEEVVNNNGTHFVRLKTKDYSISLYASSNKEINSISYFFEGTQINDDSNSQVTDEINAEPSKGSYTGNQSVEQLRKSIVGSWGLMGDYSFGSNGNCYFFGDKNNPGTYKITDDKTLIIDFPWTHNEYTWSDLSFDEFHEKHDYDEYFWCFTTEEVLLLNGDEYYRDGVIPLD